MARLKKKSSVFFSVFSSFPTVKSQKLCKIIFQPPLNKIAGRVSHPVSTVLSARVRILDGVPDGGLDLLHGDAEQLQSRFPGRLSPLIPAEILQLFEVRPGALGLGGTHGCLRVRTLHVPNRLRRPQNAVARGRSKGPRACFGLVFTFSCCQRMTDCWNSAHGACGFARVVKTIKRASTYEGSWGESEWRQIDPTHTRIHVLSYFLSFLFHIN